MTYKLAEFTGTWCHTQRALLALNNCSLCLACGLGNVLVVRELQGPLLRQVARRCHDLRALDIGRHLHVAQVRRFLLDQGLSYGA